MSVNTPSTPPRRPFIHNPSLSPSVRSRSFDLTQSESSATMASIPIFMYSQGGEFHNATSSPVIPYSPEMPSPEFHAGSRHPSPALIADSPSFGDRTFDTFGIRRGLVECLSTPTPYRTPGRKPEAAETLKNEDVAGWLSITSDQETTSTKASSHQSRPSPSLLCRNPASPLLPPFSFSINHSDSNDTATSSSTTPSTSSFEENICGNDGEDGRLSCFSISAYLAAPSGEEDHMIEETPHTPPVEHPGGFSVDVRDATSATTKPMPARSGVAVFRHEGEAVVIDSTVSAIPRARKGHSTPKALQNYSRPLSRPGRTPQTPKQHASDGSEPTAVCIKPILKNGGEPLGMASGLCGSSAVKAPLAFCGYTSLPSNLLFLRDVLIHLSIDQEGHRLLRPTFAFHRLHCSGQQHQKPGHNCSGSASRLEFDDFPVEATEYGIAEFHTTENVSGFFHDGFFEGLPVLRRMTINDDEKHDYISREAKLRISANGEYAMKGTEDKGRLGWKLLYFVENRIDAANKVIPGEKIFTPLSFCCSPELLNEDRGKKINFTQLVFKAMKPRSSSSKLEHSSVTSPGLSNVVSPPNSLRRGSSVHASQIPPTTQRTPHTPLAPLKRPSTASAIPVTTKYQTQKERPSTAQPRLSIHRASSLRTRKRPNTASGRPGSRPTTPKDIMSRPSTPRELLNNSKDYLLGHKDSQAPPNEYRPATKERPMTPRHRPTTPNQKSIVDVFSAYTRTPPKGHIPNHGNRIGRPRAVSESDRQFHFQDGKSIHLGAEPPRPAPLPPAGPTIAFQSLEPPNRVFRFGGAIASPAQINHWGADKSSLAPPPKQAINLRKRPSTSGL